VEGMFDIPRKELSMAERNSVHTQYIQCCFRLNYVPDPKLADFYRRERTED
jgi:hypothetical protein